MERRGVGKRLTDGQRVEIIKLFESGAAVTEADIARRYGVTRSAIWRLRRSSSQIMERYQEGDIESRDERRRGASGAAATAAVQAPAIAPVNAVPLLPAPDAQLAALTADAAAAAAFGLAVQPRPTAMAPPELNGESTVSIAAAQKKTPASATPATPEPTMPLVYLAAKAIGSVQSPGLLNWERVSGAGDDECFEIVNDGISVLHEGNYQLNVDLQHSQPRQNYKFTFKVWSGKKLLGQCSCPLRTKKEVAFSVLELRCRLPALAKLRVEFLAPGFAFHESRAVLRLLH